MAASAVIHMGVQGPAHAKGPGAVDKAMIILTAMASSADALTLAEISRRSGLPKATVHRLLGTLCAHDMAARSGTKYFLIPPAVLSDPRECCGEDTFLAVLKSESTPYLVELHNLTTATAVLSVLVNGQVHHVNQVYGHRGVRVAAGSAVPHATRMVLRAYDTASPHSPAARDLSEVREAGIACSGTSQRGVASIAAPLCTNSAFAHTPMALSLVGRGGAFDSAHAARQLRRTAYELARTIKRSVPATTTTVAS